MKKLIFFLLLITSIITYASIELTVRGGTTRTIPEVGDEGWGTDTTALLSDLTSAVNTAIISEFTSGNWITVGSAADVANNNASYTTIQAAINAASSGDQIFLLKGSNQLTSQLNVNKSVKIIGQGDGSNVYSTYTGNSAIIITSDGVVLDKFKLRGSGNQNYGVEISSSTQRATINIATAGSFVLSEIDNNAGIDRFVGLLATNSNSKSYLGNYANVKTLNIQDQTTSAYNTQVISNSDAVLTADHSLTLDVNNGDRTLDLSGNFVMANDLTTAGVGSLTLTTTAATDVMLPTTGTLSTLNGSETLTQKTLTTPDINGGTADSLTSLSVRSTGAAQDLKSASSEAITGTKMLSINVQDDNRSLTLHQDIQLNQNVMTTDDVVFNQVTVGNTGLVVGTSVPFSDAAGTLTLQNIDSLAAGTETVIEDSIDTLSNLASINGQNISIGGPLYINNTVSIDQSLLKNGDVNFNSATVSSAGIIVGDSTPFSDAAGTLTLQNVDVLDATTENTIESAIDTLANLSSINGQNIVIGNSLNVSGVSDINQDVKTTATPTFAGINTTTITKDGDNLTIQTTTSGNININPVGTVLRLGAQIDSDDGTAYLLFGNDNGGETGIRLFNGAMQWNDSGAGWSGLASAVGASAALDNLASVSINTSLVSDTDNTDDLGTIEKHWKNLYTKNIETFSINSNVVSGKLARKYESKSDNYNITDDDGIYLLRIDSTNKNIGLPPVANNAGRTIIVKRQASGAASNSIVANGEELIDGFNSLNLDFNTEALTVFSDSTQWKILNWYIPKITTTITPTNDSSWSNNDFNAIVYKNTDNSWWLKFDGYQTGADDSEIIYTLTGFVFSGYAGIACGGVGTHNCFVTNAASTVSIYPASGTITQIMISGFVKLTGKPAISF